VDIWEIGNEVNGNWTGAYSDVSAKIYDAWQQVHAAGKRSELTLWYDVGCDNGPSELDPIAFTNQYVSADMRNGLEYVTVSYYETQCNNIRPTTATLTTFFNQLHSLYPNAKLGFGEIGLPNKVGSNTTVAESLINYYYGLNISTPGYIGGYSGGTTTKTCCRTRRSRCGRHLMPRFPRCRNASQWRPWRLVNRNMSA
jgi:hypothetical protein